LRVDWLHKNNNSACIIFCNGWGMDNNAVKHLDAENYDVCTIHDYLGTVNESEFMQYTQVYLIAWSMGVWAAMEMFAHSKITFEKTIAINGTGKPMDNTYGIPQSVFEGTLNGWNDNTRKKFTMRMFGGGREYVQAQAFLSKRTSHNQKDELSRIYNYLEEKTEGECFIWNVAVIGELDYIFTAENQKNYWLSQTKCISLPIPHYPFVNVKKWSEFLTI